MAPTAWYLEALADLWPHLHHPWLYIASDEPAKVLPDFARFAPASAADLGVDLGAAGLFGDFHALTQADVLAISNSSFSFAAAMLNRRGTIFLRPDADLEKLIPFAPWNSEVLLRPRSSRRHQQDVSSE